MLAIIFRNINSLVHQFGKAQYIMHHFVRVSPVSTLLISTRLPYFNLEIITKINMAF